MSAEGDRVRKILTRILYTMFFGFTLSLIVSCVLFIADSVNKKDDQLLTAVSIDPKSENSSVYKKIDSGDDSVPVHYMTDCEYGYNTLSDPGEQFIYRKLQRNLYYITDEKDDNGYYKTERIILSGSELSESSVRKALNAFIADHPQIFWVSNIFGYAYDSGDTVVECYSVVSAEKCREYSNILNAKVNELVEETAEAESDYQKERILHDMLLRGCTYADNVKTMDDGWEYFTSYGAIISGSAVCEGYSKAMQLLLSASGVRSYIIRGNAEGVRHMWNLVQLGDDWYHLDATWNDGDSYVSYEYFNLPTEIIKENHDIGAMIGTGDSESDESSPNFFLPECESMNYNYYNVDGFTIERFDNETDQQMVAFILNCVNNDCHYLHLNVGDEMEYEECIDTLLHAPNHRIYHYIDLANEFLDSDHRLDREGMRILKHENRKTIRIRLSYK